VREQAAVDDKLEQRWRDERDRERIRWGVEWLGAWMPMESGGARFLHTL
jgi:hypothetical protein